MEVKINPDDIARVDVNFGDSPDACLVPLVLKDGVEGRKEQQLVLRGGRDEVGRIHARRFVVGSPVLIPSSNIAIEGKSLLVLCREQRAPFLNSHNSSRPAMSYTRN